MILGITGHRPKKLYGYDDSHPGNLFVINAMGDFFKKHEPNKVVTGMALGADQWAAQWCINLDIPFIAAVPTENQDKMWPEESQKKYQWLLTKASQVEVVTPEQGSFNIVWLMDRRNRWIVNNSET
jgi:uncharacterized phage-like protein YoqJ